MSDISRVWSPEPGPEQRTTGLKTIHGTVYGVFRESLAGLHESAWWTGIQLKCPDAPATEFYVRIMSDIGVEQPFGITTAWTQKADDWQPLPWAIPPKLATFLRLYLEITPLFPQGYTPLWVARRLGFHELGLSSGAGELGQNLSPNGRYLFANTDGQICAIWDERFSAWATKTQGHVSQWDSPYYVVPPLRDFLMHGPLWVDGQMHTMLHWNELVPMQ